MTRNAAERRLTIFVADFFARAMPPEVIWSHFPSGEHRTEQTGALLKRMGLKPGWPDFIIVPPGGLAHFIELKAGDGRLSKDQQEHQRQAQANGARWAECRSADEVETVLRMWGIALRASLQ